MVVPIISATPYVNSAILPLHHYNATCLEVYRRPLVNMQKPTNLEADGDWEMVEEENRSEKYSSRESEVISISSGDESWSHGKTRMTNNKKPDLTIAKKM